MTKIASVATYPVSVPRKEPVWTAHERSTAWNAILTQVTTDDGLTGTGIIHAGPAPRVCEYVAKFGEFVAGMDALANVAVWERLFALTSPRPGAIEGRADIPAPISRPDRTVAMAAIAGIDIALWDIKGKALEQPLWKLLGGHRDRVPTYASGSLRRGLTDSQAQRAAQILVQKGFKEMKTQMALPGNPTPAEEVRRVRVVREAIGPDIKLMCDINQRWRPEQAIDIGSRVEDVGLFWLEDVTAADDYQGLARVTAALKTPIAGGEYVYGIAPFRQMIQNHSVDIVMIDIVRAGGVTPWMKIAGMAEAFNLPVVSHVMPEILLHLIAAIPNGLTVEYMPWMLALYEETPEIENGMLVLPEKPGLGLKFDEKAIAAFKVG
jgi:L-alanine-DL-glutamate epimerase-like enolase superfamily enzyme